MKLAELYLKKESKKTVCQACPFNCQLSDGEIGLCGVRKNINGEVFLTAWGEPNVIAIDPIEKKPLYHFLPSSRVYSVGTTGCNFNCDFCQNWKLSQNRKTDSTNSIKMEPENLVKQAINEECKVIAFTYNEPSILIEYAKDCFEISKSKGLKNILVSNGYISDKAIDLILPGVDAVNIDLKSFNNKFYKKHCKATIAPVLNSIKRYHEADVWVELTTLLIPGENDSVKELSEIANFIASISKNIPWHISVFHPAYKMSNTEPTKIESIKKALDIASQFELNYSYGGNVADKKLTSTRCHNCKKTVIKRDYYKTENLLNSDGNCPQCSEIIPGIWK